MQSDWKKVTRARGNALLGNLVMALALIGLLASGARAQGVRYDNIVLGPSGQPVSSAQIAVCTAAAVRTTTPCSPLAQVYSDQALKQPMANPFTSDSLGNYGFWAEPGQYVVQIYGTGLTTRTMDVFLACDPSNCSMTSATVSSITAGTLNLTGSLTVDGRSVATEPLPSDSVQYVSPNGSDSNDGLSWGTAKQSLYAAVNTLEASSASGGTVYVAPNTACGGPVSGQGLWLVGYEDSAGYANPPSGWIKMLHPLKIVGAGVSGTASQNSPAPAAAINCGAAGNNPAIWISGVTWPQTLEIDNLAVSTAANNALVIGISTSGSPTASGGNDLLFNNDSFSVGTSGSAGPTINIGANAFWIQFNNVGITADSGATAGSDAHQAVVIDPDSAGINGIQASALIYFNHITTYYGGIHFYGNANNGGSLFVDHDVDEGANDGSPAVHISTTASNGVFAVYELHDILMADASVSAPGVEVDPGIPASNTVVSSIFGAGSDVSGPMVMQGGFNNENPKSDPLLDGREGFDAEGLWANNINDNWTKFSLQNAPYQNLISWDPSGWISLSSAALTATAAPDGTDNAWQTNTTTSGVWLKFMDSNQNVTAGDYYIASGWVKSIDSSYDAAGPYALQTNSCGSPTYIGSEVGGLGNFGNRYAGKNWQYVYGVMKIGATATSCTVEYGVWASSTQQIAFFAPVLLHIPAGTMTDAEALDLARSLGSFPPSLAAGVYTTLPNHPIAFGGSGDNYLATLDHTALTANQTYDFPNQSGTLGLVLSATTGSIGGSALAAGACTSGTASLSGSTTSMPVLVSPSADPGSGFTWEGWISSAGTATVRVCNVSGASATPTAETYNVRAIQ